MVASKKKIFFGVGVFLLAVLVMVVCGGSSTFALDTSLYNKYWQNSIYLYDPDAKAMCRERVGVTGEGKSLAGDSRAEKIWNYIANLGISGLSDNPAAIAGILGNMSVETGGSFDPFIQNASGCTGLIQWCGHKSFFDYMREKGFDKYYSRKDVDEATVNDGILAELNYLFHENGAATAKAYINNLKVPRHENGHNGARAYADLFLVTVENAFGGSGTIEDDGVKNLAKHDNYQDAETRRTEAEKYYRQYIMNPGSGGGESSDSSESSESSDDSDDEGLPYCDSDDDDDDGGGDSNRDDKWDLIFYLQCDPKWGSLIYGKSGVNGPEDDGTICQTGCGPTSFAVIAANLKGDETITPRETADLAGKAGMHLPGNGSDWGITRYLAGKYGLSVEQIKGDLNTINNYLDNGYMIHTSGRGEPPFTKNGHYIAIVKRLSNGKWLVADSSSSSRGPSREYDPGTVLKGMNSGNVWAVK